MNEELAPVMLPAGTIVHKNGIPVELTQDTWIKTHPANIPLMADSDGETDQS